MKAQTQTPSMDSPFSISEIWIKNPIFDLCLVTGGAFFTLLISAIVFQTPAWLPLFFWIWVVAFEGSHFWATFSRTYFDTKYRKENKAVLLGSLIFFVLPALALYLEAQSSGVAFATLYGFFIFCWSLYHNARQHYGFMSIYAGKAKVNDALKEKLTVALYMAICFAQIHFLFNFKIQGVFGIAQASLISPTLSFLVSDLPIYLSIFASLFLIKVAYELIKEVGSKAFMPIVYTMTCLIFYTLMFYYIAPNDKFVQSMSGVQTLMLIAIMNSLFHNIQYHAIVFHYGQKRYSKQEREHGMARFINKGLISYSAFSLALGLLFGFIVWNVGEWPSYQGTWTQPGMQAWAYVLYFGIVGHHFYLDQKIWRPSKSKELQTYLKNQ